LQKETVVIIGAGPAGLAISAVLTNLKIPFLLLEKSDTIGNTWKNQYDKLELHTIKNFSHLPFLPFPDDYPLYVTRDLFVQYLEDYSKKFDINPVFKSEVISCRKREDYWIVQTRKVMIQSKYVIICTGYNNSPNIVEWKGAKVFKGSIFHSREYKNGKNFQSKKVLIVGAGNSAGEIALDIFKNGGFPSLSIREYARIIPREIFGVPAQINAIIMDFLPIPIADQLSKFLLSIATEDLSPYGIQSPPYGSISQIKEKEKIPMIDTGTVEQIKNGNIKIYPEISSLEENSILFVDGRKEMFDILIMATGYFTALERFLENSRDYLDERGVPLIKGQNVGNGMYFLGFKNHITGFLRTIGIEAEMIGNDLRQHLKL
jgi:indole-3-pyruvate monooxygenase